MRAPVLVVVLLASSTVGGCAALKPVLANLPGKPDKPTAPTAAALPSMNGTRSVAAPPTVTRVVAMAPIPNPPERGRAANSQRIPVPEAGDPMARVAQANEAARVQPRRTDYANASQIYEYEEGALYQVYAAPGRVTDIVLQEGEALSGTGPVAAGDTVRWIIGDTESGAGATRRVHILVKPTSASLHTNLVINTNRRTYHLELKATPATYMASVAWRYPADDAAAVAIEQYALPTVALEQLNFAYRVTGDRAAWRPVRVYDDGRQTFIEFAEAVGQSELPPLFVAGPDGKATDLVNYRVAGKRLVVDRIFTRAELRLGDKRGQKRVRIERLGGSA